MFAKFIEQNKRLNKESSKLKKILYIDMDDVLVDFSSGINKLSKKNRQKYEGDFANCPGIFSLMLPIKGAIESYRKLSKKYDVYILSTAPWNNPSAWQDKLLWVKKYLGEIAWKRLILTNHKNLNIGDYLIDDRLKNGVPDFMGEHIHFKTEKFKNWDDVLNYLM